MFAQFTSAAPVPPTDHIQRVACEKTGTIYYVCTITGKTAWTKDDLLKNPTLNKK